MRSSGTESAQTRPNSEVIKMVGFSVRDMHQLQIRLISMTTTVKSSCVLNFLYAVRFRAIYQRIAMEWTNGV
jgi:hypothetical protein